MSTTEQTTPELEQLREQYATEDRVREWATSRAGEGWGHAPSLPRPRVTFPQLGGTQGEAT